MGKNATTHYAAIASAASQPNGKDRRTHQSQHTPAIANALAVSIGLP